MILDIPNGSLVNLLNKFGPLTVDVIRVYTKQILKGLKYLHDHTIIHRDIKGANILVGNDGVLKLSDFGASKRLEELAGGNIKRMSLKGTPNWMAPEVIKQETYGRQADIWSLGCTVIEMATGSPPWNEYGDQMAVLFHIANTSTPPSFPPSLPKEAQNFLSLCMEM